MTKKIVLIIGYYTVQAVYGRIRGKNIVIDNTLSFKREELESFLKKEKNREFTIAFNFKTFYSDIFYLPPVKGKYLEKILKTEIKKKFPELKDFSFLYTPLGEKLTQGKKETAVFVFAVQNEEIETVTNTFDKYGKRITHFVPIEFALSMTVEYSKEAVLCVTAPGITGINKNIFLLKEGNIIFIREVQGIDSGIHDFDVKNINMTISYCRQTLKVNPTKLLLLGKACHKYDAKMSPVVPLICLNYCPPVLATKRIIIDFMAGIALFRRKGGRSMSFLVDQNSILPLKYKIFHTIKKALSYSAALFSILLVCGFVYFTFEIFNMQEIKKKIEKERASIENKESVISMHRQKRAELQGFVQLINTTNRLKSKPNSQKLMIALSNLNINNIKINNIAVIPEQESIKLIFAGVIDAASFNETEISYRNFLESLKKIEGMEVSTETIDVRTKSINITANYND